MTESKIFHIYYQWWRRKCDSSSIYWEYEKFEDFLIMNIQGVSPYWDVMLTQAPIWGNRGWEMKFLFHDPVSLDWGTLRLTPLCTFPNFPRLWLRVGVVLFPQIGVVLRRKVWNLDVYTHLFHPIGTCFPRLGWSSQKIIFSELAMCKTTDNFIWSF